MLHEGVNIDSKGRVWNALHAAIESEEFDCVKFLIGRGADIECINNNLSPLAHAVDISIDGTIQTGGSSGDEPIDIKEYPKESISFFQTERSSNKLLLR